MVACRISHVEVNKLIDYRNDEKTGDDECHTADHDAPKFQYSLLFINKKVRNIL